MEALQQKNIYPETESDIYNQADKLSTRRYLGKLAKRQAEQELLKEFLAAYMARQVAEQEIENNGSN